MKPDGWERMSPQAKRDLALQFSLTHRGSYIISQALVIASKHLKTCRPLYKREPSNAEDMEILLELFPIYAVVEKTEEAVREAEKKLKGVR